MIKETLDTLSKKALSIGISINIKKTMIMPMFRNKQPDLKIPFKMVNQFNYLGITINSKGKVSPHLN